MATPPMHILVVDDEPSIGEMVTRLLQPSGHEVECCRSGVEALQRMQSARAEFDLLITDHHMPGTWSGLDLVSMIRRKGSRIPVFIMSGRLNLEVIADYRSLGIDALLPKPFEPSRLLRKIGELAGASLEAPLLRSRSAALRECAGETAALPEPRVSEIGALPS